LKEVLEEHGSEVSNMLITEWNWEVAKEVWQEEAREEGVGIGEQRANEKWQGVVTEKNTALAEKDAALAEKDELITKLKAQMGEQ
jgi:hypothetical protein